MKYIENDLIPNPLSREDFSDRDFLNDRIEIKVVTHPDKWLESAYQMLADQFSVDLLDPYERYITWLELNAQKKHPFPFLMMVAYIRDGQNAHLVGVFEGNIMPVADYVNRVDSALPMQLISDGTHIFTIGHQMTSPLIIEQGIKGIGTRLLHKASEEAKKWVHQRQGILRYSVLESEDASIGFWNKMGYRWPQNLRYWQPPLEFDTDGGFLYPEVEELLMLAPIEVADENIISHDLLMNIIATLYLNWSLDAYRSSLSPIAMRRSENYVMKDLFGRILDANVNNHTFELSKVDSKPQVD